MTTLAGFNIVDAIIFGIILLSILISLFRGFVREALSLASWVIAFIVALKYSPQVGASLAVYIKAESLRTPIAFVMLFIATLIICAIFNFTIGLLVDKTGLSGTDRLIGMFFGAARGILLVAALLLVAKLTPLPQEDAWKESILIPHFQPIEIWLQSFLPKNIEQKFQLQPKDIQAQQAKNILGLPTLPPSTTTTSSTTTTTSSATPPITNNTQATQQHQTTTTTTSTQTTDDELSTDEPPSADAQSTDTSSSTSTNAT